MLDAALIGISREEDFVVDGMLLTTVGGTLPSGVLSTPAMIAIMERCAASLVQEHLLPGTATVGFEVNVRHVAGAAEGATCRARATLREIADGRKLRYEVSVTEGPRTVGLGTHERRIVATAPVGEVVS